MLSGSGNDSSPELAPLSLISLFLHLIMTRFTPGLRRPRAAFPPPGMESVMSIQHHACTSISDIKALARQLRKSRTDNGVTHFELLNEAAKSAGFENYNHARRHFVSLSQTGPWVCVRCRFHWKEATYHNLVGHLQVDVTPLRGLSKQHLERIVFVIPEFWTIGDASSQDREQFRIDSAYFHRVTSMGHALESERVRRFVLSFHLLNSRWQASIFDYGRALSRSEMELTIERTLVDHINTTVELYQQGMLDESRVLPLDLYEEMSNLMAPTEQQMAVLSEAE